MIFQRIISKSNNLKNLFGRTVHTNNAPTIYNVECLEGRGLISISGNKVDEYLQRLITNDMNQLKEGSPCIYTMFLNSKGRVLHDSIIYNTRDPQTYFIECDLLRVPLLKSHLSTYDLRKTKKIEPLNDAFKLWVVNSSSVQLNCQSAVDAIMFENLVGDCMIYHDPRISNLGLRVIAPKDVNLINVLRENLDSKVSSDKFYRSLRYKLGIGEGAEEIPPEKCFPLESNCDYLNGVSFHKGCYLGQELTARSYHTGVIRKRLMPITFSEKIACSEMNIPILLENGPVNPVGWVKGIEENVGIGLLRIEEALNAPNLKVLDKLSRTNRPFWWPNTSTK